MKPRPNFHICIECGHKIFESHEKAMGMCATCERLIRKENRRKRSG